jgi:hypothetical protein
VLRLLVIILLNIRRNLQSTVSLSAAGSMLAGLMVLLVGSSVAADSPPKNFPLLATPITSSHPSVSHPQATTVLSMITPRDSDSDSKNVKKHQNNVNKPASNSVSGGPVQVAETPNNSQQTATEGSTSTTQSTDQQQPAASNEVTLVSKQKVCQQGLTAYVIPSAKLTLLTPVAADSTVSWYWETRIDTGPNQSGIAPISNSQQTQLVKAGSSVVNITASDTTQPLLTAPANANYGYSFRLHIGGPFDVSSAWVSLAQGDTSACTQN